MQRQKVKTGIRASEKVIADLRKVFEPEDCYAWALPDQPGEGSIYQPPLSEVDAQAVGPRTFDPQTWGLRGCRPCWLGSLLARVGLGAVENSILIFFR